MLGSTWATCQDIGRRYAGVTAACMNTVGTLGAAVAGWLTGTIVERSVASAGAAASEAQRQAALLDGYDRCFFSFAAVYLISAGCWLLINSSKPIVPTEEAQASAK